MIQQRERERGRHEIFTEEMNCRDVTWNKSGQGGWKRGDAVCVCMGGGVQFSP